MQPLDSDMDYVIREPRPARPGARLNALLMFPIIGVIFMLIFIGAALFQLELSGLIDSLIGLMIVLFFVFVGLLFWSLAPKADKS